MNQLMLSAVNETSEKSVRSSKCQLPRRVNPSEIMAATETVQNLWPAGLMRAAVERAREVHGVGSLHSYDGMDGSLASRGCKSRGMGHP